MHENGQRSQYPRPRRRARARSPSGSWSCSPSSCCSCRWPTCSRAATASIVQTTGLPGGAVSGGPLDGRDDDHARWPPPLTVGGRTAASASAAAADRRPPRPTATAAAVDHAGRAEADEGRDADDGGEEGPGHHGASRR